MSNLNTVKSEDEVSHLKIRSDAAFYRNERRVKSPPEASFGLFKRLYQLMSLANFIQGLLLSGVRCNGEERSTRRLYSNLRLARINDYWITNFRMIPKLRGNI